MASSTGGCSSATRVHPDLQALVQAYEQRRPEQQTTYPPTSEADLDNLVNQGFKGNSQSLSDST
eukprot:1149803-Pelagomonas_calceolata.AAC.3